VGRRGVVVGEGPTSQFCLARYAGLAQPRADSAYRQAEIQRNQLRKKGVVVNACYTRPLEWHRIQWVEWRYPVASRPFALGRSDMWQPIRLDTEVNGPM
jgi:hypothetical protein